MEGLSRYTSSSVKSDVVAENILPLTRAFDEVKNNSEQIEKTTVACMAILALYLLYYLYIFYRQFLMYLEETQHHTLHRIFRCYIPVFTPRVIPRHSIKDSYTSSQNSNNELDNDLKPPKMQIKVEDLGSGSEDKIVLGPSKLGMTVVEVPKENPLLDMINAASDKKVSPEDGQAEP